MFSPLLRRFLPAAYRSLFADPTVRRLMPAFALSDLGDGMSTVAVAWFALTLAPAGAAGPLVGIAVAAYFLPGVAGAVLLGRWLRPRPARQLLVADSWMRAIPLGAVPLVHATGALTPTRYIALLAASSLLHAWGKAGRNAVLAPVLREDQRIAANSMLSTSMWASVIAGPALAGLLAGAISPAWIMGLDALTFAVLALQAGRTSVPAATTPGPAGSPTAASPRQGLGILVRQPELLGMLVVTWFFNLAFGPVEVALPLFVIHDLHAGPDLLGTYWALFGLGAVIGALALGAARRLPLWPVMLGIIALHGLGLLPFAQHTSPIPALIGFGASGIIYGPYSALSFSLLQERTPATHLTTVLAARTAVLLTASPAGAAFGGFLLARTGPAPLIAGCGIAMVALAALAALVVYTRPSTPPGRSDGAVCGGHVTFTS
jgi:predicted MFS family arabinose efflux permease